MQAIPAAVETPTASARGFLGYAIVGFLVGVLPIALGLLWLPSLRRADAKWLAAFMALTAGLLTFLGIEALFEAFELQAALPGMLGGPGLVLLGVALSFLTITFFAARTSRRRAPCRASRSRRSSPSASACTTSARASRSARRSASAS